jgi:RHS repeat-associated protein
MQRPIQSEHLNTPRRITDSDGNTVWSWDGEPFGNTPPTAETTGAGQFTFNLRFPGQYADAETGLNYNYYRDYDPATGRYNESDPFGLYGGSVSTYGYANGNGLSNTDPSGQFLVPIVTGVIGAAAGAIGSYVNQKYIQHNCTVDWGQVGNAAA